MGAIEQSRGVLLRLPQHRIYDNGLTIRSGEGLPMAYIGNSWEEKPSEVSREVQLEQAGIVQIGFEEVEVFKSARNKGLRGILHRIKGVRRNLLKRGRRTVLISMREYLESKRSQLT